jgi:hypothetical protein
MARIRTIKPDTFLDTELAELPVEARYFFIGLWTQADREGRLEDNPKRLKAQLMPWDPHNPEALLSALSPRFITRYEAQGRRFLQVNTFAKHQRPHIRETESIIPAPKDMVQAQPRQCPSTAKAMPSPLDKGKGMENGKGKEICASRHKFTPPKVEEVVAYCRERGSQVNADRFVAYYESKGWVVGRSPMKDWKAAVRQWETNAFPDPQKRIVGGAAPIPGKYDGLENRDG